MKNHLRFLALGFCLMGIVSCASDDDKELADKHREEKEIAAQIAAAKAAKVAPICPQVAIVRDLEKIINFGDAPHQPENLIAGAKMVNVDGQCVYHEAEDPKVPDPKEGIDITFDLNFVAARGPKINGKHAEFPYFVAVVDPSGNVLQKNPLTVPFSFSSDSTTTEASESLHVFIPLATDTQPTGPSYQVLMGFQLTKEQYEEAQKTNGQ